MTKRNKATSPVIPHSSSVIPNLPPEASLAFSGIGNLYNRMDSRFRSPRFARLWRGSPKATCEAGGNDKMRTMTTFRPGQMIIISLIFLTVVLLFSGTLFGRTAGFLRFGANNDRQEQAINMAEAGVEYAIWQLNTATPIGSYTANQQLVPLAPYGEFEVTVINVSSQAKDVKVTGYVPTKAAARSKNTIKLTAAISTTQVAFNYALQSGSGGFTISGPTTLVKGNLYTGCAGCPAANIVGSGGATIDGDAYATGPTITPETELHLTPGHTRYPNQSNPPSMPTIPAAPAPYATWQLASAAGGTVTCPCSLSGNVGPKQYNGNVTMSGSAIATVQGPIYITGTLDIGGTSQLKLDTNIFHSTDTVIIVDGPISIGGGSTVAPTTDTPPGYILLATNSTATGTPYALDISGGTQAGIFYALAGTTKISNSSTNLTALVSKAVEMTAGILNYDQGLASSQFSGGPGGSWQLNKGTYRFSNSP